ncbi:MAG: type II toxin-antitoxin system RelE/ParE family toxin [bacterium]
MKLVWSPIALSQAEEIADYIADDNPFASEKWLAGLFEAVERLTAYPESGRPVPEIQRPEIREIVYGEYRILYRVSSATVALLTVRHGRRLLSENDLG